MSVFSYELYKRAIATLQINLGRRCNLACHHCHVEASPIRTEEMSWEIADLLIKLIDKADSIKTVDLTGGAPEINRVFKPLVSASRKADKEVIVRSNLTVFFEEGFQDVPEYLADHQVKVVASLPCYLPDNVDKMRGSGVYDKSIWAIQLLNDLGYGKELSLVLDLVYNPPLPNENQFSLPADQMGLECRYKDYLEEKFGIVFNRLLTITNLPVGRTKRYLEKLGLMSDYVDFLAVNFNPLTLDNLMCQDTLSIDYLGRVYDCDFNQMSDRPSLTDDQQVITITDLLESGIDLIKNIQTASYCYGCTAGKGSSCGGSLI